MNYRSVMSALMDIMSNLAAYLNRLTPEAQREFAARCGTSVGYLRKAASTSQRLGVDLVIKLDRESGGALPCEAFRPDVDWAYLRSRTGSDDTTAPARALAIAGACRQTSRVARRARTGPQHELDFNPPPAQGELDLGD